MKFSQAVINVELLKYNAGEDSFVKIPVSGNSLLEFSWQVYTGFASAELNLKLLDVSWDLGQQINLFQFNKGDYIQVNFQFGHSEAIWISPGATQYDKPMSGVFRGVVTQFEPNFTENGIELSLTTYNLALQKSLKTVNTTYQINSSITNLRDAYLDIANFFNIKISSPAGSSLDDVDLTDFRGEKKELTLPPKRAGITGLDYLADIYAKFPVTIGGNPTFIRFNADTEDGWGSFEILPYVNSSVIKRIYRWNGDDSKIISFTPVISPFKLDKLTESTKVSYVDYEEKKSKFNITEKLGGDDIYPKVVGNQTEDTLKNLANQTQANYLKNILTASMKILCDPQIFVGTIVQVELYKKVDGALIVSFTGQVLKVRHYLEEAVLYTDLELARTDIEALTSTANFSSITDKLMPSILKEDLYSKQVNEYSLLRLPKPGG